MATLERIVSFWSKSGVGKKGFWVSEHRWRPERGSARGVGDPGADWGRGGGYQKVTVNKSKTTIIGLNQSIICFNFKIVLKVLPTYLPACLCRFVSL